MKEGNTFVIASTRRVSGNPVANAVSAAGLLRRLCLLAMTANAK